MTTSSSSSAGTVQGPGSPSGHPRSRQCPPSLQSTFHIPPPAKPPPFHCPSPQGQHPPSEFTLGTAPSTKTNCFFLPGVTFPVAGGDSSLQMANVPCQEHAAAVGSLLAQSWAERTRLQNVIRLRAVGSRVLQHFKIPPNSVKNM